MILEKDPSKDREEFEKRLIDLFNGLVKIDIRESIRLLILKDEVKIAEVAQKFTDTQLKIDQYLAEWDAASDENAKRAVVNSVKI